MTPSLRTLTNASIVGFIAATVFITAITIVADLHLPIKDWLKNTHGHHWVGKGIWTVVTFVAATLIVYAYVKKRDITVSSSVLRMATHVAIAGSLIMCAFFVYEYLKH